MTTILADHQITNTFYNWADTKRKRLIKPNEEWWGIIETDDKLYEVKIWTKDDTIHYNLYNWSSTEPSHDGDEIETGTLGIVVEEYIFHRKPATTT